MRTTFLLLLFPVLLRAEVLEGDAVGKRLNNRVVVRTMPRRPMPEYITLAECQTLELKGGTVKNFGGSCEVPVDGDYAQVKLFKSVDGTEFRRANLCNVETKNWTNIKLTNCTTLRFRPCPANGLRDRLVKADGTYDTKMMDGTDAALEVVP